MQEIEYFTRANRLFSEMVYDIADDQWALATPNSEWNVHDLVNHVAHNEDVVTSALKDIEGDVPDDLLGDDTKENFRLLSEQANEAASEVTDGSELVASPVGEMSARDLLRLMTCDRTIHAWDLGKALGVAPAFDEDILEAVDEWFQPPQAMRDNGAIGPELEAPVDADILTRVLARSGRQA